MTPADAWRIATDALLIITAFLASCVLATVVVGIIVRVSRSRERGFYDERRGARR
jgi:flagellar biosynthesis protein FliQ